MAAPEPDISAPPALTGRVRPLHPVGPIAGSVFTVLAWAAIAHNSGSGWVQALGVMLGSVLVVGLVAPGRVVNRARVSVKSSDVSQDRSSTMMRRAQGSAPPKAEMEILENPT